MVNRSDAPKLRRNKSPWDENNFILKFCYFYLGPTISKIRANRYSDKDLNEPPEDDKSAHQCQLLRANYELCGKSMLRATAKTYGPQLFTFGLLQFMALSVFQLIGVYYLVLLMRHLVSYQRAQDVTSRADAYTTLIHDYVIIVASYSLENILSQPYWLQTKHIGIKCRAAMSNMIYDKSLRLSASALHSTSTGDIVNLLASDIQALDYAAFMIPYVAIVPVQAVMVVPMMVSFLGLLPTLAMLSALVVYLVIQFSVGKSLTRLRSAVAQWTDERTRLTSEVLKSMQVVKMYNWERPLMKLIGEARAKELLNINAINLYRTLNQSVYFVLGRTMSFLAIITFVLRGHQMDAATFVAATAIANLIRFPASIMLPSSIAMLAQTIATCRRVDTFLALDEVEHRRSPNPSHDSSQRDIVVFDEANGSWRSFNDSVSRHTTQLIRNLTMSVRRGELLLVVGPVGGGKTSFLMSIMGELPLNSGRVDVRGSLSYAPQQAWILHGTVRDNILLGAEWDRARYDEVIQVCGLEQDLDILVDGDETLVGDRGSSLSGGQKARVGLARALYRDADIYLLDDPLSAVDAPVARSIFKHAIRGRLAGKTVIIVTHQVQFANWADRVLVVNESGHLIKTPTDLLGDEELSSTTRSARPSNDGRLLKSIVPKHTSDPTKRGPFPTKTSVNSSIERSKLARNKQHLVAEGLDKPIGHAFKSYVTSGASTLGLVWFMALNVVAQSAYTSIDAILASWTNASTYLSPGVMVHLSNHGKMIIYGSSLAITFLFAYARARAYFSIALNVSRSLHKGFVVSHSEPHGCAHANQHALMTEGCI